MRRASQLFCLLVLYLFIFLGTRYMLKTVCLFSLLNLKCLTGMWQVLFLIYSLWKSHQGLERIKASCGWPRHEGQLSESQLNDKRRRNWGTAGSESLHMSTWLCRWQTLRDETEVWALSCGHHVFLTGARSPLHGSHWWFSSSPWTSRPRGVLSSATVVSMGNMFLSLGSSMSF